DGNATRFDLRFTATRNRGTSVKNLGAEAQGVEGVADSGVTVPLTTTVDFNLSFGVDTGPSGNGTNIFFVRLPSAGIVVQSNIDAGELELPMYVGLLQAESEDGSILLDADTTLAIGNADTDGDSRLRLTELSAAHPTANHTGVLFAQLPFMAQAG